MFACVFGSALLGLYLRAVLPEHHLGDESIGVVKLTTCRERKKVEMLFTHLKRILKLDRLRRRGPSGAHDEFLMAATAQNLRRMAKWLMPGSKKMNRAVA